MRLERWLCGVGGEDISVGWRGFEGLSAIFGHFGLEGAGNEESKEQRTATNQPVKTI